MTAGIGTHLRNPLTHALMRWPMSSVPRRRSKPFDSHKLFDPLRIDTAVLTGDAATQGVPNDGNGKHLQLFEELRHIQDIIDHGILSPPCPLRVPMPAQIRGNNVIGITHRQGYPIPIASMITSTMNK